jgi:hypothetical protein
MTYDDRASNIRALLWEHAHPALRSMDRDRIAKLAEQIMRIATDRGLWTKWGSNREEIAERAANLWIPLDDLREALNALPGPALTRVDVEQRIRDFREKQYGSYPKAEVEAETLAAFAEEKARGTEFIAVLDYLEEWYWGAEERLRQKRDKDRREQIAKDKQVAEARLRNGADCPWTAATGVADLHCCKNGRLYRLRALQTTNVVLPQIRLCFTLCGARAMLHVVSRDGIRKDGKISVVGARAEAESHVCRARRPWLDRLVGQPR